MASANAQKRNYIPWGCYGGRKSVWKSSNREIDVETGEQVGKFTGNRDQNRRQGWDGQSSSCQTQKSDEGKGVRLTMGQNHGPRWTDMGTGEFRTSSNDRAAMKWHTPICWIQRRLDTMQPNTWLLWFSKSPRRIPSYLLVPVSHPASIVGLSVCWWWDMSINSS